MKDISLSLIGRALLLSFIVLVASNVLLFIVLYADTFAPIELPYTENFDENNRITWRQHGGTWVVRDSTMLQTNDSGTDLMNVIPLKLESDLEYRFSADLRFVRGRTGGGLMFNMQESDTRRQSHMVRFGTGDDGQGYIVYGIFDENFVFKSQGTQVIKLKNQHRLGIQIHNNSYDVLIDDQIIAENIDLVYSGGYPALTSWFSMVAYDNISLMEVDDTNLIVDRSQLAVDMMSPTQIDEVAPPVYFYDDFTSSQIGQRWMPISGQWQIENNILVQQQAEGFDLTVRTADPYSSYVLTTRFQHKGDSGAGVIFNMPNPDNLIGAHMARFFSDNVFVWGYFDEQDGFVGQGFLPMESAIGRDELLTVVADGQAYSLVLNGIDIVNNVPLVSTSGYVGLTTSQTTAVFDQVEVRSPTVDSLIQTLQPKQGDWSTAGSVVTQNASIVDDFHRSIGVYGEVFTAQVIVKQPDRRSNAQAGLLFHAPDTQNIRGAHWVRLANDGIQLIWGIVDTDLNYIQNGVVDLDTAIADSRLLTIQVREGDFDILVDNKVIAQRIPVERFGGWLSFSASSGPTQFSNFKLSLTQS